MKRVIEKMLKYRTAVIIIYLILAVIAAYFSTKVKINADTLDYLPKDSASTVSLDLMSEEYGGDIDNCSIMVMDVELKEAVQIGDKLKEIDGVESVTGIGDQIDITIPLSMYSQDTVEAYYKDGNALYSAVIDVEAGGDLLDEIREVCGHETKIAGDGVNTVVSTESTRKEVLYTIALAIVIALIIMSLTMESFLEPVLILVCIGVAIILNSGMNAIRGTISSITNTAASVLQLAVSVDYSIFLMHRYEETKAQESDKVKAMAEAVVSSASSIASSALTTVIGFAALIFMRYGIGEDMGIVLSRGVLFSLLVVFTFYPCVLLALDKAIVKTKHKALVTGVGKLPEAVKKIRFVAVPAFFIILVICFFAQSKNEYWYGSSHMFKEETELYQDTQAINEVFGESNTMVLMVPKGEYGSESLLVEELEELDHVTSVTSYSSTLGYTIPAFILPESLSEQLLSDNYSRIVLIADCGEEDPETFALIDQIKETAGNYYETSYLAGTSPSVYDLKDTITEDNTKVNLIAVIAIFLILLLTFKSPLIAVLLVLVIKGCTWIVLGIAYYAGVTLFYIGYLIVSSILIGATVDYAILMTSNYREARLTKSKEDSMNEAIHKSTISIATSALILSEAGILLAIFSSSRLIFQLGLILAAGTSTAAVVVIFILPNLLRWMDWKKTKNKY